MVTVNRCCCCLKLKTGGFILGILGVFLTIFDSICIGYLIVNYDKVVSIIHESDTKAAEFCETYKNGKDFFFIEL